MPPVRLEFLEGGDLHLLDRDVTTVGRAPGLDVVLDDPRVSRLHAELVRRGPVLYVSDLGLSTNGTTVNGRPICKRVLDEGDVIGFAGVRARITGLNRSSLDGTGLVTRAAPPDLTRRESEVLALLCRPAIERQEAFVAPATARDIAAELVVTEAAVKQHLLRLYGKFAVPEGENRRIRLANQVLEQGLVRP